MKKAFIFMSLLASICLVSCNTHHQKKEEETKFLITSPLKKDTAILKDYVCQIHSIQHIELRALERGYLQNIYVDEGQMVKKGQLMFQIMPLLYQAELQKAKAEAEFAQIEYQNTKSLADSNIVSKNELALAKAKYDKALAELQFAQVHLSFTEIRAPFDGIMDRFYVRLGSLVDEGDLLTILSDNSQMWVYFNVPEAEYLDLKSNSQNNNMESVQLKMANGELFKYSGKVTTIEADFNNETGNIAFRATFENPERLLRHGETGSIIITIPVKDALLIPQKATFEVLDKRYVFTLKDDGVLDAKIIEIAAELPHLFVVSEGITENDKFLLDGLRKVKNGDKIETEFKNPKDVLSNLELYAE